MILKKKKRKKKIKKKKATSNTHENSDRKTGKVRGKNIASMSNASATFGDAAINEKCITTNKYLNVADKTRNFIEILSIEKLFESNVFLELN